MFRTTTLLRTIHFVLSVCVTALLLGLWYEVILDRITLLSWVAVGTYLGEALILAMNRWRCPLTLITEALGSRHARVTDLFLPRWLADRAFEMYGALFGAALAGLAWRLLT